MRVNHSKGWWSALALDQDCILCRQRSRNLLCETCIGDINGITLSDFDFNLLNNIRIARELKSVEFECLLVFAEYQWPLSQLISDLKFAHKVHNCKALADLFCGIELPMSAIPQALIPIPLHLDRLVERQFNQASLIADQIANHFNIMCLPDALKRHKITQAQTALNSSQRMCNLRNAFVLNQQVHLQHVALFDDVITTGATLSAAVKCLSSAYPMMRIDAWAMCITPENR